MKLAGTVVYFTVTNGHETGVELVLILTTLPGFLFKSCCSYAVTSIFQALFP